MRRPTNSRPFPFPFETEGVPLKFVALGVLGVLALFVTGCFVTVSHERFACVICRRYRLTTIYVVVPVTRERDNACSLWYAAHVEPKHAHVWEPGTCVYESDLWGFTRGVGCRSGRCPIHLLPPETQMEVYRHFRNPLEAKVLFANLTDAKTHGDRLDENDEDKGHLVVDAIGAWESAGFPGAWDEWWGRWYEQHIEERMKYVEWAHDDGDLNFQNWLNKHKAGANR